MSSRAEQQAARRRSLIARSERLRQGLGADAAGLAGRFRFADQIVAAGRSGIFKVLLGGAAALLLSGRAGRLLGLASRIAMLYPLVRRALLLVSSAPKLVSGETQD